jgi:hypothetical protein
MVMEIETKSLAIPTDEQQSQEVMEIRKKTPF